jgi:hypothetical protein
MMDAMVSRLERGQPYVEEEFMAVVSCVVVIVLFGCSSWTRNLVAET